MLLALNPMASLLHKRPIGGAVRGRRQRESSLRVNCIAQIIDGKKVAEEIRGEIAVEVQKLKLNNSLTPGLGEKP